MRFVSEAARKVTDPVFGVSENKLSKPERGRGVSFGVQADEFQQGSGRWGGGKTLRLRTLRPNMMSAVCLTEVTPSVPVPGSKLCRRKKR